MPSPSLQIRACRGFSLIELMIAVAVVGILGAVAYPAYTSYVQRGYISGATAQLSKFSSQLEQYYLDNRSYNSTADSCGGSPGSISIPSDGITTTDAPNFLFTCQGSSTTSGEVITYSNQAFTVTAQGTGSMSTYAFTIDHQGSRKTTAFPGAANLPRPCWLLKVGDC